MAVFVNLTRRCAYAELWKGESRYSNAWAELASDGTDEDIEKMDEIASLIGLRVQWRKLSPDKVAYYRVTPPKREKALALGAEERDQYINWHPPSVNAEDGE